VEAVAETKQAYGGRRISSIAPAGLPLEHVEPIDAGLAVLDLRHQRFPGYSRTWSLMRLKAVTACADPSGLITRGCLED
jgi:hypothetical protein